MRSTVTVIQHTHDWDLRFRTGDTPWEDDSIARCVVDLIREYAPPGHAYSILAAAKG